MTFLHPQTFYLGRFHLTVPGPDADLAFSHVDINGVNLSLDPNKAGETFAGSWKTYQDSLKAASKKIIQQDVLASNRVLLVSTLDIPAAMTNIDPNQPKTVTIWQNNQSSILKAIYQVDPQFTATARTETLRTIDLFRIGYKSNADRESAFFVQGGAIVGLQSGSEGIAASVSVPLSPATEKIFFEVITDEIVRDRDDSLLARIAANKANTSTTVLRQGPRTVAGMTGHEHIQLAPDPYHAGSLIFSAAFEFGGRAHSATAPRTTIRVDGTAIPPSVTARQMTALWDAVLDSLSVN